MEIAGLQKFSLVDYPEKIACVVFTGGCNLRCPFCHNSGLLDKPEPVMDETAFFEFLREKTGKLDGVCVSGGEPCMNRKLTDFLYKIKKMGYFVKLDTNGSFPEVLQGVLQRRLADYVAVDIKNSPERYAETTGVRSYSMKELLFSLELLMESGIVYELRTTVVKPFHAIESFEGIYQMLEPLVREKGQKIPKYFLQSFVDRETVPFSGFSAPSGDEMERYKTIIEPITEYVGIR